MANLSERMTKITNSIKQDVSYDVQIKSNALTDRINAIVNSIASGKVSKGIVTSASNGATVANVKLTESGQKKIIASLQNLVDKYGVSKMSLSALGAQGSSSIDSYSNTGDYLKVDSDEETNSDATVISSDPIRPEDAIITLTANDVYDDADDASSTYTFNLNDLYEDTPDINLSENKYSDMTNGDRTVNPDDVIAVSSSGLVMQKQTDNYEELSSYRLIMNDYLKQDTVTEEDEYRRITRENFSDKFFGNDPFHNLDVNGSVNTQDRIRYRYVYGFDNIIAAQRTVNSAAGYISSDIDVSDCSYIELITDVQDNVEYSILDGKEEIPILPTGQSVIKNEKLFFGIAPRFEIMNPNDIVVKKDGETIGVSSLQDLQLFLLTNNTDSEVGQSSFLREGNYTIDYEPGADAQSYHPNNDKIRLKIIQRNITGDAPIQIDTLVICKYGHSNPWALSTFDTDIDYNSADPRS